MSDPIGPQGDYRLVGKDWGPQVARMLQDFMRQVRQAAGQGVSLAKHARTHLVGGSDPLRAPGTPLPVAVGGTADAGDGPSFMREDAQLIVQAAAPTSPTGAAAAAGVATTVMRSDATIKQGIVTTKGDLLGYSTVPERLPVGATDGDVLTVDSAQALGVAWAAPTGGSGGSTVAAEEAEMLALMGL